MKDTPPHRTWGLAGRMEQPSMLEELPVFSCGRCGSLLSRESLSLHAEWHEEQDERLD